MPDKNEFSCIPKEPLIKLDDKGQAPIVKYTMPHETSYSAKSFTPLSIERNCFKKEYREDSNLESYKRFEEAESLEKIMEILHIEFSNFRANRPINREIERQVLVTKLDDISTEIEANKPILNLD